MVEITATRNVIHEMPSVVSINSIDCFIDSAFALWVYKASCLVLRDYLVASFIAYRHRHLRHIYVQTL